MEKRKYQVFVSSTFADLKEERKKILTTLLDMDCIPAGMEHFPAIDQEQFEYIKRVIDESDYYILVIAGRYGSTHPELNISYTELEYNYAIEKGKPVIALIHQNPGNISLDNSEKNETGKVKLLEFRDKAVNGRIVRFWQNADELVGMLATSLLHTIKSVPAQGWLRADSISNKELLEENHKMRKDIETMKVLANYKEKEEMKYREYMLKSIMDSTSPASAADYKEWLDGYRERGGTVSKYKINRFDKLRKVKGTLYLPPLYAYDSLEFIVPLKAKVVYLGSSIGHCKIYYLKDFTHEGHGEPNDI